MKVFIVWSQCYDDVTLHRVFISEDAAKEYVIDRHEAAGLDLTEGEWEQDENYLYYCIFREYDSGLPSKITESTLFQS